MTVSTLQMETVSYPPLCPPYPVESLAKNKGFVNGWRVRGRDRGKEEGRGKRGEEGRKEGRREGKSESRPVPYLYKRLPVSLPSLQPLPNPRKEAESSDPQLVFTSLRAPGTMLGPPQNWSPSLHLQAVYTATLLSQPDAFVPDASASRVPLFTHLHLQV